MPMMGGTARHIRYALTAERNSTPAGIIAGNTVRVNALVLPVANPCQAAKCVESRVRNMALAFAAENAKSAGIAASKSTTTKAAKLVTIMLPHSGSREPKKSESATRFVNIADTFPPMTKPFTFTI